MGSKDYSLLEVQPLSLELLEAQERSRIVVSAVIAQDGQRKVVSSFGDDVWEMWPFFEQSNRSNSEKRIDWTKVGSSFRDPVKAVIYRYWMVGRPGFGRPVAGTLRDAVVRLGVFLRHLEQHGVTHLADVDPLHVSTFVRQLKDSGKSTSAIKNTLSCVDLLQVFRDQHPDAIAFSLWSDSSVVQVSGHFESTRGATRGKSGTPVIPPEHLARLYSLAERVLAGADRLLDERDAGSRFSLKDEQLLLIRDVSFLALGLLTGMRCDELVGIEIGALRTEIKDGFTFHWIKSIEHKTKKGSVEYLVGSFGVRVTQIMERWSEPYRARLARNASISNARRVDQLQSEAAQTHSFEANRNRLFLAAHGNHVVSGRSWGKILRTLAARAGVVWNLAPHQMRRTYARTFVQHRLGNVLLLKDQFKHSTLEMTQLYAANPMQDEALYDECLAELYEHKVGTVEGWFDDQCMLSGGAGKKLMLMRANAFPDRASLLRETADKVSIRSTGHSWCLSQLAEGCGGQGLYERTHCVPCGSSVIDSTFQIVWREIYVHQLELRSECQTMGAGVQQRVERDLRRSRQVLSDLGVTDLAE